LRLHSPTHAAPFASSQIGCPERGDLAEQAIENDSIASNAARIRHGADARVVFMLRQLCDLRATRAGV
jgi:hypothetical protein